MAIHLTASLPVSEEEDGTNILLPVDERVAIEGRAPKRQTTLTMFLTAVVGSALVAAAVLITRSGKRAAPVSMPLDTSAVIEESEGVCGSPFNQCGGTGFTGAACCKAGCVCKAKSTYFAQCVPAAHGTSCDPAAAQALANSIMHKAIPWQAKSRDDAVEKAAKAEKAATAAEALAKAERKASDLAAAEARAAKAAFAAIKSGNGATWVEAIMHQGGIAKLAKDDSDAATAAFTTLSDLESSRTLAANNLITALPKAHKLAGQEKLWSDNLADDAVWTPIGNFKKVAGASEKKEVVYDAGSDSDADASSSDTDDKLVGGVYFTR